MSPRRSFNPKIYRTERKSRQTSTAHVSEQPRNLNQTCEAELLNCNYD